MIHPVKIVGDDMPTGFDPNVMPCSPCVARLQSPAEQLERLRERILEQTDPLVTLTHLLHLCRDEHQVLWAQVTDPRIRAILTTILHPIEAIAVSRPAESTLDTPMRSALAEVLIPVEGVAPVMIAHALARFVDQHYGDFLADSFRRRSPYQPAVGDPIPLGVPDIRAVMDMRPTAPPWRLANRLDETRRVRLAGGWATQFRIVFDYSLFDALADLVTIDTIIATCHPNTALTELTLPADPAQPAFPVRPTNVRQQRRILDELIGAAAAAGASIVVLPELCVTESLSRRLQAWVRRPDGPRLLVAGSYHHSEGSPRRRRNTAAAWVRGHPDPLIHEKHSPAQHPILEDIQPQGWPELRVYVTAAGWHIVVAICRDLLNPQAVHALTEAGANLVLVPAMSERLTPFTGQIAHLVGSSQALVAVANNPADWADPDNHAVHRPARALFGHPGLGQQTRLVASADAAAGFTTMHVRSALIGWTSIDAQAGPDRASHSGSASPAVIPPWAQSLAAAMARRYPQLTQEPRQVVTLRPAAVLVVLTSGPAGPRVLLTERATDLCDYPGRLTFPGGAQDSGDTGPIDTALREAAEEIGLNPHSVHLLGALPAMTDPESKFLVTPVLTWCAHPEYSGPVNLAEVASILELDVRAIGTRLCDANPGPQQQHSNSGMEPALNRLGALTATVIDILSGLLGADTTLDKPAPDPATT